MKNIKIIPTHNGLERIKTYSVEKVFKWIKDNPRRVFWEIDGFEINTKRAKIFYKKGIICVNCGVKGEFFALEKDKGGGIHLDLLRQVNG
jgi:3-deoxy-D-arabino-heptulosonate 7-phosphate (DAHP) synthase class II